jgi:hypothetical protein
VCSDALEPAVKGPDRFDVVRLEPIEQGDDVAQDWVEWVMVPLRRNERVSAALREVADAWDAHCEAARRLLEASRSEA